MNVVEKLNGGVKWINAGVLLTILALLMAQSSAGGKRDKAIEVLEKDIYITEQKQGEIVDNQEAISAIKQQLVDSEKFDEEKWKQQEKTNSRVENKLDKILDKLNKL